ncbi:MAG TPA: alpha/beta hydrolase-fold protein, partial [Gammaproteobacteria bacterium]|nr:alpha/beta hydrolase-fold protein [Gammaproteobacteria bacterium]
AAFAQNVKKGRVVDVKVHGRSLEGNLEGEPADVSVSIYLPPSYDTDTSRRYPVVYLLHGYGLTNGYWVGGRGSFTSIDVPGSMDGDIASGKGKEMILVMPNADTKYGGSMYSSSTVIGDWESFIADDLVSYVDGHYRTLADRESRGLAGHSMGGYGTIRIGMKRPDVFSSLYIMSACCLMNNPSARRAGAAPTRNGAPSANARTTSAARPAGGQDSGAQGGAARGGAGRNGARSGAPRNGAGRAAGGLFANVLKAEAAAWSPDPKNAPTYYDLPGGKDAALVAAKWEANSPLAMIDQYIFNLKKYNAIGMDVGNMDSLMGSNEQLANVLGAYGIDHSFEIYEGTHANHVAQRIEQKVIPFFSEHLQFGAR